MKTNLPKRISHSPSVQKCITEAKRFWYGSRGEPISYGRHHLRFLPGTRPVRLKYADDPDPIVRNDARQIQFCLEEIKAGDYVLDIGGHFGQYAVLFGALVSNTGKVVSFEPDPQAQRVLSANLGLNGLYSRVLIESIALFDRNGEHVFFSKDADSMSSLARSGLGSNADSEGVAEYKVRTVRLDDYFAATSERIPSFVKIDTEGAEINILRGADKLMKSPATIVCELHPYVWDEFGTSFAELRSLVADYGKTMEYLDPAVRIEDGAFYGSAVIR